MRTSTGLRIAGSLLAIAMLAGACTTIIEPKAPDAPDQPTSQTLPTPKSSPVDWKSCHSTFECATVSVPLNWFHDTGKTIKLALIRKPATEPNPIGSLLLNPGGPGEPGVGFLQQFMTMGDAQKKLNAKFDLVSWDPRGTGASSGVDCSTKAEMLEPDPLPIPRTQAKRDAVAAKDRKFTERCVAKHGDVIPYVGTRQTAHDLDAIRSAVGDDKLTYVGYSYGTAIGLQYLQDFPDKVRAMALDGIVIPGSDPIPATKSQIGSFESNLNDFLADCKSDKACPFGNGNPAGALTYFLDVLATGKRIPADYSLPDDDGVLHTRKGTVGKSEALEGILTALYSRDSWSFLQVGLKRATDPTDPDGGYLLMLRDQLEGRNLDGTWNHSTDANIAISCADQSERADAPFGDPKLVAEWTNEFPFFGAVGAVGQPGCYQWPAARYPLKMPTKSSLAPAPPIMIINSSHDPATPYESATRLLALLPHGTLVTYEGEDHTSFARGHSCVDGAVVPYLISLERPATDITCTP